MPTVVIKATVNNGAIFISVNPPRVHAKPSDPIVKWKFSSDTAGWEWDTDGIKCDTAGGSGYTAWPKSQPTLKNGEYEAPPLQAPTVTQLHKYTISLKRTDGSGTLVIDPDIANDPQGDDHGEHRGR